MSQSEKESIQIFFTYIVDKLYDHPYFIFLILVFVYFSFSFTVFYSQYKNKTISGLTAKQKIVSTIFLFLFMIVVFLIYRLVFMTNVLDYPFPKWSGNFEHITAEPIINYLVRIGVIK